jgi:hypothetical protein
VICSIAIAVITVGSFVAGKRISVGKKSLPILRKSFIFERDMKIFKKDVQECSYDNPEFDFSKYSDKELVFLLYNKNTHSSWIFYIKSSLTNRGFNVQ